MRVVDRHYVRKWGRSIRFAGDGETWVFVEVKTRSQRYQPSALDAVTPRKRRRLFLAAMSYMKWKRLQDCAMRDDVVILEAGGIEWIPDVFELPSPYTC